MVLGQLRSVVLLGSIHRTRRFLLPEGGHLGALAPVYKKKTSSDFIFPTENDGYDCVELRILLFIDLSRRQRTCSLARLCTNLCFAMASPLVQVCTQLTETNRKCPGVNAKPSCVSSACGQISVFSTGDSGSTTIPTGEQGCPDPAWSSTDTLSTHYVCLNQSVYLAILPCYIKVGSTPHCKNGRQYSICPLPRFLWVIIGQAWTALPQNGQALGLLEEGHKVGPVCAPFVPQPIPIIVP